MLTPSALRAILAAHNLRLSKRRGQHYLVDRSAIRQIIAHCKVSGNETVVEIGAGLGSLTEGLAKSAGRVLAVEIDPAIGKLLKEQMSTLPHVSVLCQDILTLDWRTLHDVVLIGAIPYQLTSPILLWACEHRRNIQRAVLVVQKEVAQRLIAKAGTKAYGRLSVLVQYHWRVERIMTLGAQLFFPPPAVDSCCIALHSRNPPAVDVCDEALYFSIVKAAFAQRRKTLVNCLLAANEGVPRQSRPQLESLLKQMKLPLRVRGEALSLEAFASLTNALAR